MEMIARGEKTAAQVWESEKLRVEDVLFALEHLITSNGVVAGRKGSPLVKQQGETARAALAGLLDDHGGERLREWEEKPESLALRVRLWLGEHYGKKGDERAVPLLESVLSEGQKQAQAMLEKKLKNAPATYFIAAERLAWFYRDQGKPEEAAQAWLRVPQLHDESDWRVADALVETARSYTQAGDKTKAQAAYDQVPQYGQAWYSGLAIYDQALALIEANKHAEGRALLQQPLSGARADAVKVGLLSLLSDSYLRTGEVEMARLTAQSALDAYGALKNAPQDEGFKYQVQRAKEVLARCQGAEAGKSQASAKP